MKIKVTILKNEAFAVLSTATGYSEKTLEELIIKRMIDENIMSGDVGDCGFSVEQIGHQNKYDSFDMMNVLFPEGIKNTEVFELLDSIFIWGLGVENPCPICGNECEVEHDSTDGISWMNLECSNPECDYTNANEPDWDLKNDDND